MSWLGDFLGCHWYSYMGGGSHAELLDDLGDILLLAESKNPILPVCVDSKPKQPGGWSEVFNLEHPGESNLEVGEELSGFFREDGVVDIHIQDVDEFLDEENEKSRVDKGLGEAVGYKP